jgi:hypothetical protein
MSTTLHLTDLTLKSLVLSCIPGLDVQHLRWIGLCDLRTFALYVSSVSFRLKLVTWCNYTTPLQAARKEYPPIHNGKPSQVVDP